MGQPDQQNLVRFLIPLIFLIPFPRVNRFDHVATIQLSRRIKGINGIKRIIVFVVVSFGTLGLL